jgi:hypothetical protein
MLPAFPRPLRRLRGSAPGVRRQDVPA